MACRVAPGLSDRLVTANFVKHSRCKQTEGLKRKDKRESMDLHKAYLRLDNVCEMHLITAEVVTIGSCQFLDWSKSLDTLLTMLFVIIVTNVLFIFISFHLCPVHHSSCCTLVSFTIITKKYLCYYTVEKYVKKLIKYF